MQTYTKGFWYYAEYESFRLESEGNFYKLYVAGYSGNAGDSLANISNPLSMHAGMNFSTPDVDNDMKVDGSCSANTNNASWWFSNCFMSCLTGRSNTKDFTWLSLHTYGIQGQGRLRAARMMIRRI